MQQGLAWPLPAELDEAGLEALLYRKPAPPRALRAAGLCADPPGAQAQRRHAAAAVGGIREGARAERVPVQPVLPALPRLPRQARPLDAPGAPRRGEGVHRLQRRHRRGDRCEERRDPHRRRSSWRRWAPRNTPTRRRPGRRRLPDWIGSTIRMLEFFGAVPELCGSRTI